MFSWFNKLSIVTSTVGFLLLVPTVVASEIQFLLNAASQDGRYVIANDAELDKAESLFLRTMQGEISQQLQDEWHNIGFDLILLKENGEDYAVLQEQLARKEGRGFYLFRLGANDNSILQAPHSYKDLRTREITFSAMLQSDYPAAAWNTVPRYYFENGTKISADLAHLEKTFFTSFTRAFAQKFPMGNLLQLHGYAQEKRKSAAGQESELILSSGISVPSDSLLVMANCMKQNVSELTYAYPTEVRELGGTTNTIGKALRQFGHNGFIHTEISRGIRERLLIEVELERNFINCLP